MDKGVFYTSLLPILPSVKILPMKLILTHENADFDAVASQLAAHKLVPDARPILPTRCNRNVRHFLRLYWDELPYWEIKELPRTKVERVLVVDTQHVQTMKGMGKHTQVDIIDHHDQRDSLKPEWQVTIDEVGATTTILCERIQTAGLPLTPVEATLLTLGIYEDTGALSYGTTTARDAYAAAWLLSQGAMLDVVRDFLHYPLADDQRALYEELLGKAETRTIEGYSVVVAHAEAHDLIEEIATLAHKLRDLLEPEAIFLLVDLGTHVQLVARSTLDAIDVGMVAEHFGGGGHGRASAAIIRDMPLRQACRALWEMLPRAIRPGLTVADLMSHGVQTLSPETRAEDADLQMRRYGYEGFPVVKEGQVAGLLTRRAVDRAMDHGLRGVRVEQLMEAGAIALRPEDSIARLQQVMMSSGWGQIPVVNGEGHVIGVVTRTDLIHHMGHNTQPPARRGEIVRRLEAALPPTLMALVREIGRVAEEMDLHLYAVGGFVRDLLLDQPTTDIDFVVEGDAIALTRALRRRLGGDMRSHRRFGTGKWMIDPGTWEAIARQLKLSPEDPTRLPSHIDFVTARTEFYHAPTVLPEVERSSIKLDLHRRDFTINTLAIQLDPHHFGQLLDFYGGEADLHEGRIRVLHSISFVDDPTRILRAVRLEQRLGFEIEPRTEELIGHARGMLDRVSGDRIRHEIELILAEAEPERALCRLARLKVLSTLHPDLRCDAWLFAAFRALREAMQQSLWPELTPGNGGFNPELPYFALLTYRLGWQTLLAVCKRLKVKRRTVDELEQIQGLRAQLDALSQPLMASEIDSILRWVNNDRVLATLWAAAPQATARDQIADYACRLRHISPTADGDTLKEMGLKPGPAFREILDRLRAAWLDGEVTSPAEEKALLERTIAETKS